MINILLIDTTQDKLLVGLIHGERQIWDIGDEGNKKHNTMLLPSCEALLSSIGLNISDITHIACNCGVGSFTGIRLGVTTVNGLAAGSGIRLIEMNTLEIIAYNVVCNSGVLALLDSGHDNYYAALNRGAITKYFDCSHMEALTMACGVAGEISECSAVCKIITMSGCAEWKCSELDRASMGGLVVLNTEDYCRNFAELAAKKCRDSIGGVSYLRPFYLKDSQAERELAARSI